MMNHEVYSIANGYSTRKTEIPITGIPIVGDIFTVTLDLDLGRLSLKHPKWKQPHNVALPQGKNWYPHFNLNGSGIALI